MDQTVFLDTPLRESLQTVLDACTPKNIFLVTGHQSFASSGAKKVCDTMLKNYTVTQFSDFSPNPDLVEVMHGIERYNAADPDLVLAIGGGSAIDIAKAVNALAVHSEDPAAYIQGEKNLEIQSVPLVAVPTTAGTGSESTHFAVVYIGNIKYSLAHDRMLPQYAIVDSKLSASQPPHVTAATGLDALSQAIESYWSTQATDESKRYAYEAIPLIMEHLPGAVAAPTARARRSMALGAHLAGKAINISKTTASHAMSYPLTKHFGLPHGHAVVITLPALFLFNAEVDESTVQDSRGVAYVRTVIHTLTKLLGEETPEAAAHKLTELVRTLGFATALGEHGVGMADIDALVSEMSLERAGNNPRVCTKEDATRILQSIL
jgi:alcohol dehydrogenase class IV